MYERIKNESKTTILDYESSPVLHGITHSKTLQLILYFILFFYIVRYVQSTWTNQLFYYNKFLTAS